MSLNKLRRLLCKPSRANKILENQEEINKLQRVQFDLTDYLRDQLCNARYELKQQVKVLKTYQNLLHIIPSTHPDYQRTQTLIQLHNLYCDQLEEDILGLQSELTKVLAK
jgi:hypothetical protein